MKVNIKKILTNKLVLYLVFFISLATIFRFLVENNCAAILFFILLALLTSYFSKNMIIILGSAIIGTNFLALLNIFDNNSNNIMIENFESENNSEDSKDNEKKESLTPLKPAEYPETDSDDNSKSSNKKIEKNFKDEIKQSKPSKNDKKSVKKTKKQDKTSSDEDSVLDQGDIIPNSNNLLNKDDISKSTEKEYDKFDSAIGSDNIRNHSVDTKKLLDQQLDIMKQMKDLTPLITQTMGMVNNLDFNNISNMFDKVTKMLPSDQQ